MFLLMKNVWYKYYGLWRHCDQLGCAARPIHVGLGHCPCSPHTPMQAVHILKITNFGINFMMKISQIFFPWQ